MQGQDKVKARPKSGQGEGEFKVRLRQRKHNLNHNNNLMGFDTIEINLVFKPWLHTGCPTILFPLLFFEFLGFLEV